MYMYTIHCLHTCTCVRTVYYTCYWGEPERAPHISLLQENRCSYVCVYVCILIRNTSSMCCIRARTYVWLGFSPHARARTNQEMKEQLGPSYNSLSLQSDSLCLLISLSLQNFLHSIYMYKTNFTYDKGCR